MHSVFWALAKSNSCAGLRGAIEGVRWDCGDVAESQRGHRRDGLDFSHDAFIQESEFDEIAFAGGADPLELRRKLMTPYPVATRLIDAVALMSDWRTPLAKGKARGFSFTLAFGTWMAQVVQVSQEDAGIRVEKVFCAADPGPVRDERDFRGRMTTAIMQALSSAIGKAVLPDAWPRIGVTLQFNSRHRLDASAPLTPPVVPALANAIFALSGKRIRRAPLGDEVVFV